MDLHLDLLPFGRLLLPDLPSNVLVHGIEVPGLLLNLQLQVLIDLIRIRLHLLDHGAAHLIVVLLHFPHFFHNARRLITAVLQLYR